MASSAFSAMSTTAKLTLLRRGFLPALLGRIDDLLDGAQDCPQLAQQFCNSTRSHCPSSWAPLYAVRDASATSAAKEWRCYSDSCLTPDHKAYKGHGCADYCTRDAQIKKILATCQLRPAPPPPPKPTPLPPTNRFPTVDVFTFGEGTAACYRIPSLAALPDGLAVRFEQPRV